MADPHWLLVLPGPLWVAPRVNAGTGPAFRVLTNKPSDIFLEVATDRGLFANPGGRTPGNFYHTLWDSHRAPTMPAAGDTVTRRKLHRLLVRNTVTARSETMTPISIDNQAWARLVRTLARGRHGKLYYRAFAVVGAAANWFFTHRPAAIVTTADAKASQAPYIEVRGVGDRAADRRFAPSSRPSRSTQLSVFEDRIVPKGSTGTPPPRVLRGVNFSGLQHRRPGYYLPELSSASRPSRRAGSSRRAADIVPSRLGEIKRWGANIIRLPVNQDWVLNGNERSRPLRYLRDLDRIVRDASRLGIYALISNQIIRRIQLPNNQEVGYIAPLPDHQAMLCWLILARRYRREPGVMFDLSNEPHRPDLRNAGTPQQFNELDYYTGPLVRNDATWVKLWHDWVRALHGVIRTARADHLIFVSGIKTRQADRVSWAADLSSMPVNRQRRSAANQAAQALSGVIYSSHMYPRAAAQNAEEWNRLLGRSNNRLAGKHPIFIGEWGPRETDSALQVSNAWVNDFSDYLRRLHGGTVASATGSQTPYRGLAGWNAWAWGDRPDLVERVTDPRTGSRVYRADRRGNRIPTPWGVKVQALLQQSVRFGP